MSKLRVQADLIFEEADQAAADTYAVLVALAPRLQTIAGGERGEERSRIELHRCHHDEPEGAPCEPLDAWEAQ
jgi:hypothetical protein